MDFLDWIVRISGVLALGLLGLDALGRLNPLRPGDTPLAFQLLTFTAAFTWVTTLCLTAAMPIRTVVFIANGSDAAYDVTLGRSIFCLPGRSYQAFTWRRAPPERVTTRRAGDTLPERYPIGPGTWFISVAPASVYADIVDVASENVVLDAINVDRAGTMRINLSHGRPFRLYSQAPLDRIYSAQGDIVERRAPAPCSRAAGVAESQVAP